RYRATAVFEDGSWRQDATSEEGVWAESAPAAARKWYWKLTGDERARCVVVAISAYIQTERYPWQAYDGETVAFAPKDGWRQVGGPILTAGKVGADGEVHMPDPEKATKKPPRLP